MRDLTWRMRLRAAAGPAATVVTVLAVIGLIMTMTIRATVLDSDFYLEAADDAGVYERLYDEVVFDPDLAQERAGLLARQPIAPSRISSNLRLVLPPETLRAIVESQVADAVAWLRGDRDELAVSVDLTDVLDGIRGLALVHLSDLMATTPSLQSASIDGFLSELTAVVEDLRAGRRPVALPQFPLDEQGARRVADLLVAQASAGEDARQQLEADLLAGDLGSVLVTVGADVVSAADSAAAADLQRILGQQRWDVTPYVEQALGSDGLDRARQIRAIVGPGLTGLQAVLVAMLVLGAVALAGSARARGRNAFAAVAATVGSGAVLAAILGGIGVLTDPDLTASVRSTSWPPTSRELVVDVVDNAETGLVRAWFVTVLGAVVVSGGLAAIGLAVAVRRNRATAAAAGRPKAQQIAMASGFVLLVLSLPVLAGIGVDRATRSGDARLCNGSRDLCDRRYDEAHVLVTHNSMSTTEDRFLFPLQDPDIPSQLDSGVRGLMLDVWEWEEPSEFAARFSGLGLGPGLQQRFLRLLEGARPARDGLWLCHAVCGYGAISLADTLANLREWLVAHPNEVVTLIIQDEVEGERIADVFVEAGLSSLVAELPAPEDDWPRLGEMIDSGRRLVVFTEKARDTAPWLQRFYDLAEETPFALASVEQLRDPSACRPNRGGTGQKLFLLNNFVTLESGSRSAAAVVNSREVLLERIRNCTEVRGRTPTFVAVDYATIGDAPDVIDLLNAASGN